MYLGLSLMPTLPGDGAKVDCPRNCHGESGCPCCVSSSIVIFVGLVAGSGRERGTCGWGWANRVRVVFPVAPIRPRRDP